MDSVEASGETKIGAIVHNQLRRRADAAFQFFRLLQHQTSVSGFVAILEECDAAVG
jgi:hypothetical protein